MSTILLLSSYTTAMHPRGVRGYLFQSYGPCRTSYAEIVGSIRDVHIMLRVLTTCIISLSHNRNGKLRSVVASAAMNASLNVCIACLAALTLWLWGSGNCNLHSSLVRKFFIYFVAWLSITFKIGLYPLLFNSSKFGLYALKMHTLSNPVIGVAMIALEL